MTDSANTQTLLTPVASTSPAHIEGTRRRSRPRGVRLEPAHAGEVAQALRQTNGKATSHAYTNLADLTEIVRSAEQQLENLGIPVRQRCGAAAVATSGGTVPKCYKYSRDVTTVYLRRGSRHWYLMRSLRTQLWPSDTGGTTLYLTESQDAYAVQVLRRRYGRLEGTSSETAT